MSLDKEEEEQTVREFLSEMIIDPLIEVASVLEKMLNQILDLPMSEKSWKLLREFLAVKSK